MSTKSNDLSRIIIELPKAQHRKLKSYAATHGKSMRQIILEALEAQDIPLTNKTKTKKPTKNLKKLKSTYKTIKVDTRGFKFNREEIYDE